MSGMATLLLVDDTPENLDIPTGILKDDYRLKVAAAGRRQGRPTARSPAARSAALADRREAVPRVPGNPKNQIVRGNRRFRAENGTRSD